ncbi:MAG: S-methyl-5-thioribose-1-phosphate isomerase [Ignavibacteriales bacterium]|nr:S-methyl-5-thioribose-1-phosphate isomerase [Ignavibacteriales bacterium]
MITPLEWRGGRIRFLDQTKLPTEETYVETDDPEVVADAIRQLAIRGAPLIGIAAAYGVALSASKLQTGSSNLASALQRTLDMFASTRPTAVNLFWALNRQKRILENKADHSPEVIARSLLAEALKIHEEDRGMCTRIGEQGAGLLSSDAVVLTHCNTGRLATGGSGTAQSIISTSWEHKKLKHVYIDETRPLFQGARLTAWELGRLGIPSTLITDNTAAFLMQKRIIHAVITGADRITLNGDVANKVGTYNLAVLAHYHSIPMYVAAPSSSIDFEMEDGKDIPIEQRSSVEMLQVNEKRIAPPNTQVFSPAFDVTPGSLVSAIITERGVFRAPYRDAFNAVHHEDVGVKSGIA